MFFSFPGGWGFREPARDRRGSPVPDSNKADAQRGSGSHHRSPEPHGGPDLPVPAIRQEQADGRVLETLRDIDIAAYEYNSG